MTDKSSSNEVVLYRLDQQDLRMDKLIQTTDAILSQTRESNGKIFAQEIRISHQEEEQKEQRKKLEELNQLRQRGIGVWWALAGILGGIFTFAKAVWTH